MKVGKAVAIAVGGSIILLQIANEQGYIKVNWDKLASKTDKLLDKVEERVTGEGPNLLDKVRDREWFLICFNRVLIRLLRLKFCFAGKNIRIAEQVQFDRLPGWLPDRPRCPLTLDVFLCIAPRPHSSSNLRINAPLRVIKLCICFLLGRALLGSQIGQGRE